MEIAWRGSWRLNCSIVMPCKILSSNHLPIVFVLDEEDCPDNINWALKNVIEMDY